MKEKGQKHKTKKRKNYHSTLPESDYSRRRRREREKKEDIEKEKEEEQKYNTIQSNVRSTWN